MKTEITDLKSLQLHKAELKSEQKLIRYRISTNVELMKEDIKRTFSEKMNQEKQNSDSAIFSWDVLIPSAIKAFTSYKSDKNSNWIAAFGSEMLKLVNSKTKNKWAKWISELF